MLFWIFIGAMALGVTAILVLAILRDSKGDEHPAAYDMRVYRDQLDEIERDKARGLIGAEDADRTKAEVSRRLLAADAQMRAVDTGTQQPKGMSRVVAMLVAILIIGGAVAFYYKNGAPGYGDMGLSSRFEAAMRMRAERPSQEQAEEKLPPLTNTAQVPADYLDLLKKLRVAVANRPDDLQGQLLLARHEAATGNLNAAYRAQAKVLSLKGDQATAQDYATYADMLILAAGGYVSPKAEKALLQALERAPRNGTARYYMGLMAAQTGRPDQAFHTWNALLNEGPADAPWIAPIRAQIEDMAARAGQNRFTLPEEVSPALPGPSASDVEGAADMSAGDRQQMIAGMVNRLMERLANEGGSAEEWARLVNALGVLGDTERAKAIWNEARLIFGDRPEELSIIQQAARTAGVAE